MRADGVLAHQVEIERFPDEGFIPVGVIQIHGFETHQPRLGVGVIELDIDRVFRVRGAVGRIPAITHAHAGVNRAAQFEIAQ